MVFRSCIKDKSKSDCRVNGPPPASRVCLRLRGHRQLEREDQTAPTVVMVPRDDSSHFRSHIYTHDIHEAHVQSFVQNTDAYINYDGLPLSANTSSLPLRLCQTRRCLRPREKTSLRRCKCNLRLWNEFICQKNIICWSVGFSPLPEHLLPPRRLLLWSIEEEEKGLQGHGPTPDLIGSTIPC